MVVTVASNTPVLGPVSRAVTSYPTGSLVDVIFSLMESTESPSALASTSATVTLKLESALIVALSVFISGSALVTSKIFETVILLPKTSFWSVYLTDTMSPGNTVPVISLLPPAKTGAAGLFRGDSVNVVLN